LYYIVALIFIANIFSAFFNPAILTLPLEIEKGLRVQLLTARLTTVTSMTTVVGPILGLLIFNKVGVTGLFFISFISYLVSGFFAYELTRKTKGHLLKHDSDVHTKSVPIVTTLSRNYLIAVMLTLFLCMNLLLSPIQVLMPSMAKNIFNNSLNSLVYMEVIFGLGVVLGGIILSIYSIKKKELYWVWVLLVLFSSSYVLFNTQHSIVNLLFFLFLMGSSLGLVNVLIINIFQERPLKEDVPNIMSITNLISTASVPFSLTILAILQKYTGVEKLGLYSSIGLFLIVLLTYFPFKKWGSGVFK
ncbi:MAG: MFS transporter, partial [Bdellovibrionales bacterium]|nr:MFS transporter [Bdellovibrionales bacterium]